MSKLESFIDHTLLKPEATPEQVEILCEEARKYNFRTICVNPAYIEHALRKLVGTGIGIGTVCGFPLGATKPEIKRFEAEMCENAGANEIDMVANIGAIKAADFDLVKKDIAAVRKALVGSTTLKVILECSLLTEDECVQAAQAAVESGVDFVKTSTGFFGGATLHHVSLLFDAVGSRVGIKASGGIKDMKTAMAMIEAGASRIGTSSGAAIMEEYLNRSSK